MVIHCGCHLAGARERLFRPVRRPRYLHALVITDNHSVYLLSTPLPLHPIPIVELHHPLPPPILTGAPLFIAAVKHLRKPWLLPDVPKDSIVAFTSATAPGSDEVAYVGVGRIVAEGGMRGAVERRAKLLNEGADKDEGKFCDILCIIGDQLVHSPSTSL